MNVVGGPDYHALLEVASEISATLEELAEMGASHNSASLFNKARDSQHWSSLLAN